MERRVYLRKRTNPMFGLFKGNGAPGGVRTPDPVLRRHVLYPSELRARSERTQIILERASCYDHTNCPILSRLIRSRQHPSPST